MIDTARVELPRVRRADGWCIWTPLHRVPVGADGGPATPRTGLRGVAQRSDSPGVPCSWPFGDAGRGDSFAGAMSTCPPMPVHHCIRRCGLRCRGHQALEPGYRFGSDRDVSPLGVRPARGGGSPLRHQAWPRVRTAATSPGQLRTSSSGASGRPSRLDVVGPRADLAAAELDEARCPDHGLEQVDPVLRHGAVPGERLDHAASDA